MYNPMDLTGKQILITGGAGGIGRATAKVAAELGATVVLLDKSREGMEAALAELPGEGHRCFEINLREIEGIEPEVEAICAECGMFHGFVHCAGIAPMRPFKMTKYEDVLRIMQINFFSFVEIVRTLTAKKSRFSDGGSIVAMSSTGSIHGKPTKLGYSASKAALDASVRCMICDLKKRKIRMNTVMPSWVHTFMYDDFLLHYPDSPELKEIEERQFMGVSEPEEVANTIAFLLSDATNPITGTSILMDGGVLQG